MGIIDCDVHNDWQTAEVLLPYLDPEWRDYFTRGELPGLKGAFPHAHRPWLHPEDFRRADIHPQTQLEHYTIMKEQVLDHYPIEYAILTGEEALEASTLANPHYATALAKSYNRWLIDYWLPLDARFKGSLIIAPQDPHGSAAMIRELGTHPDIVQVFMSSGSYRPYGDRFYHPIWEAASEVGLPMAVHLGGQGGINYQPIGSGPVTFYWETHTLLCQPGMTHVTSAIVNGCFEKWPNVKLVLVENGVAWFPPLLWRMDANYKALRRETPWLKRLPSEYARTNVRFTTQPLETPPNNDWLIANLEAMDAKHTLMFASDYPHWDFDDPFQLQIPEDWKENIFRNNALDTYTKIQPKQDGLSWRDVPTVVAAD